MVSNPTASCLGATNIPVYTCIRAATPGVQLSHPLLTDMQGLPVLAARPSFATAKHGPSMPELPRHCWMVP